ncbi:acyltransferase family protein [Microbacterium sp. HA-8]|uniref:acyltransferase family protein n=1 Tax=Microbacterium sp. HA-8 TaxID=3234200 RepID=UPI0038F63DEF
MTTIAPRPRYAGLDGLRAVAVALVVLYHLFPAWWLRQGFIGVDVFFVISGFLITSLLLRESARAAAAGVPRAHRIDLLDFWRRRARRLLPALVTLIAVCGLWAWFVGGDVLVGLGRQVLGALTFSYNWASVAAGAGYFEAATPEVFRNLWSLAVEEQFYVLWPLLLPLVLLVPSVWARAVLALAAAGASAAWMAAIVAGGGDLTRAYFGTDTHAFGILLGVALAFALQSTLESPARWMLHPLARSISSLGGFAAVAALVLLASLVPTDGTQTFPGVLLAASALTLGAILAGAWPGSWFGRAIDVSPLRWVGARSYGIYLWHWPVVILLMAAFEGPGAPIPPAVGAAALAITLGAATLSYRFVEQPVRRLGFRGSAKLWARRMHGTPRMRFVAVTSVTAFALAACATTGAIAAAPRETSAESAVEAGARALERSRAAEISSGVAPTPTPKPTYPAPPRAPAEAGEPSLAPQPATVTGDQITAVGDSVMLASAGGLVERLPGIHVDAAVSRSMYAGPGILESLSNAEQLRPYVVVALGTNGPVNADALTRVADIVGPDRSLILVNAFAPRDWIEGVNADLAAFAASRPGVVVADWSGVAGAHTDTLAGDHIHPGSAGGRLFADTVASAVQSVEDARAQAEFERSQQRSALVTRLLTGS